jgi:hypothetical protein
VDIVLLVNNTIDYVFYQLFGNLLIGQTVNNLVLLIVGAFLLLAILFFSRKLFGKLCIPFAFLLSILAMTILSADIQANRCNRYIFIPTVVIFSILMYEGREQWQNRKKNLFSIAKIALFTLFFLLISVRVARNYFVDPLNSYPWKTQATLFDPQGNVFYSFPINPIYWSVVIPSSYDRKDYIPESLTKISIDDSRIIKMQDIVVNDSLYTVTGPNPTVVYQLPEKPLISYCWIDFDRSLEYLQFIFHCDNPVAYFPDKGYYPMIFNVSNNNLMNMNERIQINGMNNLKVCFYAPLSHLKQGGAYSLQDSSFVIKRFELYALPSK